MVSRIRNSIVTRFLCGLLALYLLNISVDTADKNAEYIAEDLSLNDQESIVELIIEKVLGIEDAIKEYDDLDTEDHNKKKTVKIDSLFHNYSNHNDSNKSLNDRRKEYPGFNARLVTGFEEIDSPPPKI